MPEDVNQKIIRKIRGSSYSENLKEFLIKLIREEFINAEQSRWSYSDFYDTNIKESSRMKVKDGD